MVLVKVPFSRGSTPTKVHHLVHVHLTGRDKLFREAKSEDFTEVLILEQLVSGEYLSDLSQLGMLLVELLKEVEKQILLHSLLLLGQFTVT